RGVVDGVSEKYDVGIADVDGPGVAQATDVGSDVGGELRSEGDGSHVDAGVAEPRTLGGAIVHDAQPTTRRHRNRAWLHPTGVHGRLDQAADTVAAHLGRT